MATNAPTTNNNNNNNNNSRRKTVQDYGLIRHFPLRLSERVFGFLTTYFPGDPGSYCWNTGAIYPPPPPGVDLGNQLCFYGLSAPRGIYITFQVSLTDGEGAGAPRLTEMRYRDMVIDNVLAGGGDLSKLRTLATKSIFNEEARDSIESCFKAAGKSIDDPGAVEVKRGSTSFVNCLETNVFAMSHASMLKNEAEALAGVAIKRFVFHSEGLDRSKRKDFMNPTLHMIVELERPNS